ncbi:MAG: hypothetical protein AB8H79_21325 [Myxococcota bacterium]
MSHDPTDPLDPADAAEPKANALDAPSTEPSDVPSPPEEDAFDETLVASALPDEDMELPPPIMPTPSAAAVAPPPIPPPTPDAGPDLESSPPPVGDAPAVPDAPPAAGAPPVADAPPPPKKKKGKGLMIGCGVVLVLLLLVGGVLAIGGVAIVGAIMGGGAYLATQFDEAAMEMADEARMAELNRLNEDAPDAVTSAGEDGSGEEDEGSEGQATDAPEQTDEELAIQEALALDAEEDKRVAAEAAASASTTRNSSSGSSSGGTAAKADTTSGNRGSTDAGASGTNRGSDSVVAEPDKVAEPETAAPAKPAANTGTVNVKGKGKVVLKSGSAKYNVPGNVPAGRYEIHVTFPGESKQVTVGKVKVRSGATATIRCNAAMGLCVAR